jgi:hypothetical protein
MVSVEEINRNWHDFYKIMGPFFGSRKIAKEVGIHIYDDAEKRWFVAMENGFALGFASIKCRVVSDCYVMESARNQGIFSKILAQLIICTDHTLRANCTNSSKQAFLNAGFAEISKTKNFTKMELCRG